MQYNKLPQNLGTYSSTPIIPQFMSLGADWGPRVPLPWGCGCCLALRGGPLSALRHASRSRLFTACWTKVSWLHVAVG